MVGEFDWGCRFRRGVSEFAALVVRTSDVAEYVSQIIAYRAWGECPAAWTVFRGCLRARCGEGRRGEFRPIRRQAMDFEDEAGFH